MLKSLLKFPRGFVLVIALSSCAYNYQEKEKEIIIGPAPACDTSKTYVFADVSPIFDSKCKDCHEFGSPALSDYASFKDYINTNKSKFENAVNFVGSNPMPKGGPKLPDADICKIMTWIKQGVKP
jgi:cytochrome c5